MKIFSNEFKSFMKNIFHRHKWEFHQVLIDTDGDCKNIVMAFEFCPICCKYRIVHILPS